MQRHFTLAVVFSFCALAAFAVAPQRTFVSGKGLDTNDCSLGTPCRSFGTAVTAVAAGGEVVVLDSAGYGPTTISKAVTIESPLGVYAGVSAVGSVHGISITAGVGDVVVIRNLTINGLPGSNGINATSAKALYIDQSLIANFTNSGFGISVTSVPMTYITDTTARNCGAGAYVTSGRASIDRSRFEGNSVNGVWAGDGSVVSVRDSVAAGNAAQGFLIYATSQTSAMNIDHCMATHNGDGVAANATAPGYAYARVTGSAIVDNFLIGLNNINDPTVTFLSLINNMVDGNLGGNVSGTIAPLGPR